MIACSQKREKRNVHLCNLAKFYQRSQRPHYQSKVTWNQVCVLVRHKLWRFFFGKTLSTTDVGLACCCNFREKCELPKLIFPVKIIFILRLPGRKWQICRDQSTLTFSSRAAWVCLQSNRRLTPRLTFSPTKGNNWWSLAQLNPSQKSSQNVIKFIDMKTDLFYFRLF